MTNFSTKKLPEAFLNSLLDYVDPHQPPRDEQLLTAQRLCGRWLALRRLRIGLASEQLARIGNVPVETIQILEAGIATPDHVSSVARQHLSRVLAPSRADFTFMEEVICLALGSADSWSPSVMDQVIEDL